MVMELMSQSNHDMMQNADWSHTPRDVMPSVKQPMGCEDSDSSLMDWSHSFIAGVKEQLPSENRHYLGALFSPSELLSSCSVEDLKLQRPALTSTPLRHCSGQEPQEGAPCRTPAEFQEKITTLMMSGSLTPTPLRTRPPQEQGQASEDRRVHSCEPRTEQSSSQQSSTSSSEVVGPSMLGTLQLQLDTPHAHTLGCFPLEAGSVDVWWSQTPVGYMHSPECPACKLSPFKRSGELQFVMLGKTEDQKNLTEQARLYLET